jgi:hypothetical protein
MMDLEQALAQQTETQPKEPTMSLNSRTVRPNHRPTYGRHAPPEDQNGNKKPKPPPSPKPAPKKRQTKKQKR